MATYPLLQDRWEASSMIYLGLMVTLMDKWKRKECKSRRIQNWAALQRLKSISISKILHDQYSVLLILSWNTVFHFENSRSIVYDIEKYHLNIHYLFLQIGQVFAFLDHSVMHGAQNTCSHSASLAKESVSSSQPWQIGHRNSSEQMINWWWVFFNKF